MIVAQSHFVAYEFPVGRQHAEVFSTLKGSNSCMNHPRTDSYVAVKHVPRFGPNCLRKRLRCTACAELFDGFEIPLVSSCASGMAFLLITYLVLEGNVDLHA